MVNILTILLFVLPLSVDTFAIAAAVGAHRLCGWSRWRISTIFALFEGGTPLIGLGLGSSVGQAVGDVAEYLSAGLLVLLGGYLWWSNADRDDDDDETTEARKLINARGLALIGLALSISLDELAIGFSFGLGNLAAPTTLIAIIAIQTLVVSQLGLSLGARISERLRERIERIAPPTLILLGCYPLAEVLMRTKLAPARGALIVSIFAIVLAAVIIYRRHAASTRTLSVMLSGDQRPACGTLTGQPNQSELPRPGLWRHRTTTLSRPPGGRHRAHRGVSSRHVSTSY